jgi:flagellar basal-body rod protein FlgB
VIDSGTIAQLLDACALRQRVLANNIANVNTPGFRRSEVTFEEAFAKALRRGDLAAARRVAPGVVVPKTTPVRPDGNDVDLYKELGAQSTNALLYRAYLEVLDSRIRRFRAAIGGR